VCTAAALAPGARAQENPKGLADLLSGKSGPVSLRLKDLDASWRRVVIRPAAKPAGPSVSLLSASLLGDEGSPRTYYTQGRLVAVGGKQMLVAYAPRQKPLDPAAFENLSGQMGGPSPDKVLDILMPAPTPDTPLDLSLIDLSSVAGIEGIRPFDLGRATTDRASMSSTLATTAAILFPVFAQARLKAQETSSVSNLKQVALGVLMYTQDYDERLPPMQDLATMKKAIMPYVRNEEVFKDPRTGEPYRVNPAASRKPDASIAVPAQFVLLYESTPSRDGKRAVAFADGHVKRLDPAEWEAAKKKSGMQ
jgi:prepilin-type processing-associated H-X9-DG protein